MTPYRDWDRDSGVQEFDIGDDYIDVRFKSGAVYRYSSLSAGPQNLAEMIRLAQLGDGLNSFIGRVVAKRYEQRLR